MTASSPYAASIFNDVIGPVMRGASSSHVAAAYRIGQMARAYMRADFTHILIEYDIHTSLAPTHESQGSDMGLFAGLMDWEITDDRLAHARTHLEQSGYHLDLNILDYGATHANTYRLTLSNDRESCRFLAISTGGGMIELTRIDHIDVSFVGDKALTLLWHPDISKDQLQALQAVPEIDHAQFQHGTPEADGLLILEASHCFTLQQLENWLGITCSPDLHRQIPVILPIATPARLTLPFQTAAGLCDYAKNHAPEAALWELALLYESQRGQTSETEIFEKMRRIVQILKKSVAQGIAGTTYNDRILPAQAPLYQSALAKGQLLDTGLQHQIILAVSALMDVKSAMGVIVAAPTAGSCGTLPGTVLGAATALDLSEDECVKAMLAAGLIGVFISNMATFSAELGGCQAETGAGAGMAAAALVTLQGGRLDQALSAASLALQNTFGLVCDPVANRVESPCMGKNVMNACNALASANMILAGFDSLIPLDEVIIAMHKVGQSLPCELRCTGMGGLAMTPTAKKIEAALNGQ